MELYSLHKKYINIQEDVDNYSCFQDESFDNIIGYYSCYKNAYKDKTFLEKIRDESIQDHAKCSQCPVNQLTKRKYNNNPCKISDYCNKYNIMFDGNKISCSFYKEYKPSMEYTYYIEKFKTKD